MKVDKRANFCIFLVITILALGLSNFAAAFTGDLVMGSFPEINETDKMIALDDDGFTPSSVYAVYEKKEVVEDNQTDNETDTNSTIEDDTTDDNRDNTDSNTDDNNNDNDDSDSGHNVNPSDGGGGDDSDSSDSNSNG